MFKSKLQELCQRRSWSLPEYSTFKEGLDHDPRFRAVVVVDGQNYETPAVCRSSKDAQNAAARVAFDSLSVPTVTKSEHQHAAGPPPSPLPLAQPPVAVIPIPEPLPGKYTIPVAENLVVPMPVAPTPASLPIPPPGLLAPKIGDKMKSSLGETTSQKSEVPLTSNIHRTPADSHTSHLYKNRLQQYAQKINLKFPVYTCESEGPPHARKFKSRVHFDGKCYETVEFFPTLKEAEHATAKVACQMLSVDESEKEGGLFKNLLQEFIQKQGFDFPVYETYKSGLSHTPIFRSTVKVGNNTFPGDEAFNKKHAEMNAAKVAYYALAGNSSSKETSKAPVMGCNIADNFSINIQPEKTLRNEATISGDFNISPSRAAAPSNLLPVQSQAPSVEPQSKFCTRTVVVPRHPNPSIPEGAVVLPFSDDNWVAYKVELKES